MRKNEHSELRLTHGPTIATGALRRMFFGGKGNPAKFFNLF